jgi:uncharacterized protein YbjT (DUF2867 family)
MSQGVDMQKADEQDEESVRRALKGCYAVWAVTNFWDPAVGLKEEEVGKKLATLAREEGVQHYLWSTLVDAEKISHGKYKVPHFTGKARVDDHIRKLKFPYHTFMAPAFYYQNFFSPFFVPSRTEDDELIFSFPISGEAMITAVDIDEIGSVVLPILKKPEEWHDRFIPVVGDHLPLRDYLEILSVIKKQKVRLDKVSREGFGNEELSEMLAFFEEFHYYGPYEKEIELGKKLNPNLSSWRQYLEKNQEQFQSL